MFHVYMLKSAKREKLYIGVTSNLTKRIKEHNAGVSQSTKPYIPWLLVYYESYRSAKDARDREFKLKHYGQTFRRLKERLADSLR